MPTLTTNYSFNQPLVNNPVDQNLWGGQLNTNWGNLDTILAEIVPIGTLMAYAGTTAPNSRWLLCDGAAVSRTTYATLFALVGTAYGAGDMSTTFNLPDYRGRAGIGLDNLGGASANRITDSNADSLNNTGAGDEDDTSTISGSVSSHVLTEAELPSSVTISQSATGAVNNSATTKFASADAGARTVTSTISLGSGNGHTHADTFAISGTGTNTQPWISEGRIIKALL